MRSDGFEPEGWEGVDARCCGLKVLGLNYIIDSWEAIKRVKMQISKTGTSIQEFEHIFRDGNGGTFRSALGESFLFASQVIRCTKELKVEHGLELWDQAIQYKLGKLEEQLHPFADNITCILEKQDSKQVWQYGFSITTSSQKKQRLWTLPDGILKTSSEVIALELDHGNTIGKWASQLIKAVRILASKHISGVLYCFCMEEPFNKSGYLYTEQEPFTEEFKSLLQANLFEKKLGYITLFSTEWQVDKRYEREEFIDFYKSMKPKPIIQEILSKLEEWPNKACP